MPYIVNFSVGALSAQAMLHFLAARGVYVSSGSACSKGNRPPSWKRWSFPRERIQAAPLRVSFSHFNTLEDVDALMEGVRRAWPVWLSKIKVRICKMKEIILIKLGEIVLKGLNRQSFEFALIL